MKFRLQIPEFRLQIIVINIVFLSLPLKLNIAIESLLIKLFTTIPAFPHIYNKVAYFYFGQTQKN
jgi:hypothetical protein